MPPFRIIRSCPACLGSGITYVIDRDAMVSARRARRISIHKMAKLLKIPADRVKAVEEGWVRVTPEIEQAYVQLLPKKARGGL